MALGESAYQEEDFDSPPPTEACARTSDRKGGNGDKQALRGFQGGAVLVRAIFVWWSGENNDGLGSLPLPSHGHLSPESRVSLHCASDKQSNCHLEKNWTKTKAVKGPLQLRCTPPDLVAREAIQSHVQSLWTLILTGAFDLDTSSSRSLALRRKRVSPLIFSVSLHREEKERATRSDWIGAAVVDTYKLGGVRGGNTECVHRLLTQ
jgi:hypothetical protein